ncbi:AAA family ATPase [Gordonia sp. TBRC 11910]|uniref:AAA family ATPase n=1 Tax=Gordonia asplenii TaxID=2725283 RepID=A0A848KS39_9ACTN|nr:RNA polymerase recycling motor ATPase HelR [Gordonia asplenii]NMN99684.1 AAA family ATPase [Gordonia asplenii]
MSRPTTSTFRLPQRLADKAAPELVGDDDIHFRSIAAGLASTIATVGDRLDTARRAPTRAAKEAVERDAEIRQLSAQLRTLRRFGLDLCLGRMVGDDGTVTYLGRTGLIAPDGRALLLDWRTPAAAPFFGATHDDPMGLSSRRRYRWGRDGDDFRVVDYWDEVFTADIGPGLVPDDNSAFLASLDAGRSPRMRDVLATIASDQDAIIRSGSQGALVVDGGPGTGKTVVALHRAAYLLYSDPRVSARRGGVLVVGPHDPYLAYVADILPDLGAEGAAMCTLRDLVPEGGDAVAESNPSVAQLKSSSQWMGAVERAIAFYEEPPTAPLTLDTDWGEVEITAADWAQAFAAPESSTPHNESREIIRSELLDVLGSRHSDIPTAALSSIVRADDDLREALNRAWPMLDAANVVGDLWSVPAYLRMCAPWLSAEERRLLHRPSGAAWTLADLPLLDAARRRLGDREAARIAAERTAAAAAEQRRKSEVIDEMIAAEGDRESLLTQFVRGGLSDALVDDAALPEQGVDRFAETFAHIVVDEAQELTDAQWQMLRARCPSGSFTVVGDRAQARLGFSESWRDRLERNGLRNVDVAQLRVNYRTPQEIMDAAAPIIRAALPDANIPTSIRSNGLPVRHRPTSELDAVLTEWLDTHDDGIACVIGDPTFRARDRVSSLTPETSKGLEFDLVVLVSPERFGAVDRYVSMTRATQELVIVE